MMRRILGTACSVLLVTAVVSAQAWQGPNSQLGYGAHPGIVEGVRVAFHSATQEAVAFGGAHWPVQTSVPLNQTLSADTQSRAWSLMAPATVPPGRSQHVLVNDRARDRLVMFGGAGTPPAMLGDTWTWDGADWTQESSAQSPVARRDAAAAYDERREVMVLFGGNAGANQPISDTWEWDGQNWSQIVTATQPPALIRPRMAYDMDRGRHVLIGLMAGVVRVWEYDGVDWADVTPATGGSPSLGWADVCFDPVRDAVLVVTQGDTWAWDGSSWTLLDPSSPPGYEQLVFDEAFGVTRAVMVGGQSVNYTSIPQSPWTIISDSVRCGSANLRTAPLSQPIPGETFHIDVRGSQPGSPCILMVELFAGTGFPVGQWRGPLDAIGAPGCILYAIPDAVLIQPASSAGATRFSLSIPNHFWSWHRLFYAQAIVAEPGLNALGLSFTEGLMFTAGGPL